MAFVLTTQIPPQTATRSPSITVLETDVSDVIDAVNYTTAHSLKWFITIIDDTNNKTRFMEVAAIHRDGLSVTHNIFGDVGDRIKVIINVILNGPKIELVLINNSGVSLHVNTLRLNTSS